MVEEPARNGRRPTGRPGQPRIGLTPYDGRSDDDIASTTPEIDSRAKPVVAGHNRRVMSNDMPAAASGTLHGCNRPRFTLLAKMTLGIEATLERIDVDCADPASMPRAKSDVGERELSAPFGDLGNITCGAAQPAAALHRLFAANRQRKHLETLARVAQRESPEDGLRRRHEANPKRLQTQTQTRSRSDRRAGNRKPSGVYSSRSSIASSAGTSACFRHKGELDEVARVSLGLGGKSPSGALRTRREQACASFVTHARNVRCTFLQEHARSHARNPSISGNRSHPIQPYQGC